MSDAIEVREFRAEDEPEVADLWSRVFPDDPPRNQPSLVVRRKRAVEDDLFLVAEFEGRIAGAAIAGYDGYRGYIWIIFVQSYLLRAFEAAQYFPFALLLMLVPVLRVARARRQRRAGSEEADPRGSLGAADDVEAFAAKRRTREPGIRGC